MTTYAVGARRPGPPTAVWGMWLLIATEATLFGTFIGSYYYLRFHTRQWPPRGVPEPHLVVPMVLAAVLALTVVPMRLAVSAAEARNTRRAWLLLLGALVVQAGYFVYQVHDFGAQIEQTPIGRNAYTSIYYVLLGGDHAHVFVGLLFDLWLLARLAGGVTTYRVNATRAIAWYWYFVSVLTIVVTAILLSARA